jgi:two-component system, sporulation sensor kinase E
VFSDSLQQPDSLPQTPLQQELCALRFLTALSHRSPELSHYLHEVAYGVSCLLESDWSIVTVCQGESGKVVASSLDLGQEEQEFSLHETLVKEVMQSQRPLAIEDSRQDTQHAKPPSAYLAYLGVPLRTIQGEAIGTICSFFGQPQRFTTDTIRLVETFADRAATAIDNYHLYQQQQRYMSELQQVNEQLQQQIREREQVERALRQSEARFRILVENAADAILLIDPTNGRIVDANQRACESLGYGYDELVQRSICDIDATFTLNELLELRQQHGTGASIMLERVHRRKDGTTFPVEASICLFESGDRLLELAFVRDISDRQQAQRAMTRLAEIGEFAAMIVHEVRNPLTTVLMGLTSLRTLNLSESTQERLSLALDEAERLKRLLNEILLYTRRQVLQCTELEINTFVEEMMATVGNLATTTNRRIELISTISSAWICADRDKLKQIFINLIKNACEAIDEGELITLRIDLDNEIKQVLISIRNGGSPISSEILSKLGTPFFTTKANGNGLGLAIVRRIVEAHHGDLSIISNPQAGTIVQIQLPLVRYK